MNGGRARDGGRRCHRPQRSKSYCLSLSCLSLVGSYGAPVPDEPRKNLAPSGMVISRPFIRFEPSFDWYPSTITLLPGANVFLVNPRRSSTLGLPASHIQLVVVPSALVTSTWIQECGLISSTLVSTPSRWIGFFASNSAAKA